MDPNETLSRLRALCAEVEKECDDPAPQGDPLPREVEIVECIRALDGWINRGGFLPARWTRGR